jgi:hypothetical protein
MRTHFEPPLYFTHGRMEELRRQAEPSRSAAEAALRKFAAEADAGTEHVHVPDGPTVEAIVRLAAELGARLIVMGTHAPYRAGPAHDGLCRRERDEDKPVACACRPHLCRVNNTPIARWALMLASGMASCTDAQLTALHVRETDGAAAIEDICAWIARASAVELRSPGSHARR